MSKKIVAFGASSSRNSINKKLAKFAAHQVENSDVVLLDLNDFEMPIYSIDREKELGIPEEALEFKKHIEDSDGIVISFAEHNGAYSAAYKNVYDWTSRIEQNVWKNKPMFLLGTSPGGRGAKGVLNIASNSYRFANKNTIAEFSLPLFNQNFNEDTGILDEDLNNQFKSQLEEFKSAL